MLGKRIPVSATKITVILRALETEKPFLMKNLLLIFLVFSSLSCSAQRDTFKNLTEKNGKVGIGTTNPDELLTVKGTIHTQEVKVDLEGAVAPDYVFESYFLEESPSFPSYERRSLAELESYLKEYHHLPGIPSADTMKTEGIALKEMNLRLLEKIEELYLYTLEQQEEIDQLKQEMQKLKADKE